MGTVNLSVLNKAKWRQRTYEQLKEALRLMCEPFTIDSLYPVREVERPLGSGQYINVQQAMQHQALYHAKKTPSGKDPKFILLSGGMGCLAGETLLNGKPIQEWVSEGSSPGSIATLAGASVPQVPYLKGVAPLWRVVTSSGREVTVTKQHRFLTPTGWDQLADLIEGSLIAVDDTDRVASDSEKSRDCEDRYWSDLRPCGELLPPAAVVCLDRWRQLRKTVSGSSASLAYIPLSTDYFDHLSCYDRRLVFDLLLCVLSCGGLLPGQLHTSDQVESWNDLVRTLLLLAPSAAYELACRPLGKSSRYDDEASRAERGETRQVLSSQALSIQDAGMPQCTLQESSYEQLPLSLRNARWRSILRIVSQCLYQEPSRLLSEYRVFDTLRELCQSLVSCLHYTSSWEQIVSITFIREDKFYDIGVPDGEHYSAQGIWHHNSGKSVAACVELLWLLRTYPGLQVCVVAAFDYYFDEFFLPTWHSIFSEEDNPLIKKHNVKSRTTVLTNGSVLRCKAYDDADRIKGWQAHVVFIMEGGLLGDRFPTKARAIFNALLERLRAPGRHYPRRIYIDQNPEGHNWSWELFIKPNPLGDEGLVTHIPPNDWYPKGTKYREYEHTTPTGDTYYTISFGTASNPFNPPGYLTSMLDVRNEDPAMISRKIEGDFTPIHSLIYDSYWSIDTHVIPIEKILAYWDLDNRGEMGVDAIPREWPLHVGIDPAGNSSPWAIEFYVETPPDDYGNQQYLAIDEIYVKGYTWGQMAEMIKKRTDDKGWKTVHYWIDPYFGNQKHGANPTSVREEFREYGINCNIPRNYTKLPAIQRVREFLRRDNTHAHPYLDDEVEDDPESPFFGKWKKGTSMLYYVSSPEYIEVTPKKHNPLGIINWYNLKEKEVYRLDGTKERQTKENEEGLSKAGPEKIIDRDDHAQTAEMFVALGIRPLVRTGKDRPKRTVSKEVPAGYDTHTARSQFRRS